MLRILQSFRFTAPTPSSLAASKRNSPSIGGTSSNHANSATQSRANNDGDSNRVAAPASSADQLGDVNYIPYTDRVEHAFTVDIPEGWSNDGGTFLASVLESRQTIMFRSPHDEVAVMIGDAAVGQFTLPSRALEFIQKREGSTLVDANHVSTLVMHFIPELEFNRRYFEMIMRKSVGDLVIGTETDSLDVARIMTDNQNKALPPGGVQHITMSVAQTAFTCRSRRTGKEMSGILSSVSSRFIGNAQGEGTWMAKPNIIVWESGDSKTEARKKAVLAVYLRMMQTFKLDANWIAAESNRQRQYVTVMTTSTQDNIRISREEQAKTAAMSRQTVQASDDRRAKMMGDFNGQMDAKADQNRKVVNGILDQTDVTNGSQTWKVASGYTNYYHNDATGTIIGTNDPTNPGVGFTQLSQR